MTIARRFRGWWVAPILGTFALGMFLLIQNEVGSDKVESSTEHRRGFDWKQGQVYEYLLRYDTLQHAAAGFGNDEGIGGAMQLEATFELMVHEARDGQFVMSATLKHPTHAKLKMADQMLWQGPQDALRTFSGRRMFFNADASGKISMITAPAGDDAEARLFAHAMQSLLTETQVQLATDGAQKWTIEEPTLFGVVQSNYAEGKAEGSFHRARSLATSLRIASIATNEVSHELKANHEIQLNREQVLERLEGSEDLSVKTEGKELQRVSTRLSLVLARVAKADLTKVARAAGKPRPLDQWNMTEGSEQEHLAQRIDGLTFEQMIDTVLAMGAGAERTDQARFLWRATGLLTRDPRLCAKLIPIATQANASRALRALTLDLLTSVPDEAATAAMVDILRAENVRNDKAYPLYLQRLSTQKVPTEEAFALVESVFSESQANGDKDTFFASAYTLGGMAQEAKAGSPEELRAVGQLRTSMAKTKEPEAIAHHVRALGNVGRETVIEDVRRYRGHDDAEVRKAVATALGSIRSETAERELLTLVSDTTPAVQREAILSLYRREVGPEVLADLNHSIRGGVAEANVPYLLDVLKRLRKADPQGVKQALDTLLASDGLSREQRDLVEAMRNG